MAISNTHFLQDLLIEHLDEAAVLHQQKLLQLRAQEATWAESQYDDQRLEAHLDALIVDAAQAEFILAQNAPDYDANELFVYVCFLLRINKIDTFIDLLDTIDLSDPENIENISLALIFEAGEEPISVFKALSFDEHPQYLSIFLPVFVYRNIDLNPRWFLPAEQLILLQQGLNIVALGKSKKQCAMDLLVKGLPNSTGDKRNLVISALYKSGNLDFLRHIQTSMTGKKIPYTSLALGCDKAFSQYCAQTNKSEFTAELITALGIFGLADNIPLLIWALNNEELAQTAAKAIYMISGTQLMEETFVEEQWDESELFDDEQAKFASGEAPKHPDDREYGETVTQLTLDPIVWEQWWQKNKEKFTSGMRYRLGKPISVLTLIEAISSPNTTNNLRTICLDELEIRYGLQCFVQLESPFNQQVFYLQQLLNWGRENNKHFNAGAWYFNGNQV